MADNRRADLIERRWKAGLGAETARIELGGELEKLVNECLAEPVVHQTFVHRDDGNRESQFRAVRFDSVL